MKYIITLFIGIFIILSYSFSQDRYWVGGSGDWNDKNHWSEISGGESGFPIPTIEDNVYFDENSFITTKQKNILLAGSAYCKSINSTININVKGSGRILTQTNTSPSYLKYNNNIQIKDFSNSKTAYTISANPAPTAATCHGMCDGTISVDFSDTPAPNYPVTLTIQNAALGYDLSWTVYGDTTISFLCGESTNYWIITEDQDNDFEFTSANIHEPAQIKVILESNLDPTCGGYCDGSINLQIIATEAPPIVSFGWSDGASWNPRDSLCGGVYDVTLTDSDGCTGTHSVTLTEPPVIVIDDSTYTSFICGGGGNGSIDVDASGGTGILTYCIPGPICNNDGNFTGLSNGDYTVTITDTQGCTDTSGIYTLTDNPAITITDVSNDPKCNDDCNGDIDVTVGGGTGVGTYSFYWEGPGPFTAVTEDISGLCAGTYDLTVTDGVNCTETHSVVLINPDSIYFNGVSTNLTCNGICDGTITLNPTGGDGSYSYTWLPNVSSGPTANALCADTYNITITDGNSCTNDTAIIITEPDEIFFNGSHTNLTCYNSCDGTITLNPSGGTPGYSYVWSPVGPVGPNPTNLCAGTYSVTITDVNNCTKDTSFIITEPNEIFFNGSHTDLTCYNSCDGTITLNPSGGTPGYSYVWSPVGPVGPNPTNLCAGTYSVTITDVNNCTKDTSFIITEPNEIFFNGSHTDLTCYNSCDGTITLNPSGGIPGYSYVWSPVGPVGPNPTNLCAGTYSVTITDVNNCTKDTSFIITEPNEIFFNGSHTDLICYNSCDGTITLNPSGGTPGYSYVWSPVGPVGPNPTNLCAGTYSVTITDASLCTKDTSFIITEPNEIFFNGSHTDLTCYNSCDGTITLNPSGGTPGYSYVWSPVGPVGPNPTNLCAGTYSVTITDINNCTKDTSFIITEPNEIFFNGSHTDLTCYNSCDGTITLNPSGGTPGYSYVWSPVGPVGPNPTNLCAGTYSVTITDVNNCTKDTSFIITEPNEIFFNGSHTDLTCYNSCDGTITLNPSGGTPGYSYVWSPVGPVGPNPTNLCAGTYSVTITDASLCTKDTSFIITEPNEIFFNGSHTDLTCYNSCDGTITLNPSGGTPGYSYVWSPVGPVGPNPTNLCAGTYSVTITDVSGCTKDTSFIITEPDEIFFNGSHTNLTCYNSCDGTITLNPSGGTPGYSYVWSPVGPVGPNPTNLCAGTYGVTVTDVSGCTKDTSFIITEPPLLDATETHLEISCSGMCDGSIDLNVVGGTLGYSFSWTGPSGYTNNTEDINNLCVGNYCVTVTDANFCTDTLCVNIIDPYPIIIIDTLTHILCNGDCTGAIDITVTGGNQPIIAWNWTGPAFTASTEDISGLCAGTYNVTITDSHPFGCTQTGTYVITEPPALTLSFINIINPSCLGYCDASATISSSGGTGVHTYLWCDGSTAITNNNLCDGVCSVTVTDGNGCTIIDSVTIVDPPGMTLSFTSVNDVDPCSGDCNGDIDITVGGGTPGYTYNWTGPSFSSTEEDIDSLCAGIYYVTITDLGPCSITDSVIITEPLLITSTDSTTIVACNGDSSGTATVYPSGGVPPYTFIWSNGDTGQTADSLAAGYAYVTITDSLGCDHLDTANVLDNSSLVVSFTNVVDPTCFGYCDGIATLSISGGTPGYTYLWCDGNTAITNNALCNGNCNVTVTDNLGCLRVETITLTEPDSIEITFTNIQDLICWGDTIGEFTVSVTGGTPPYLYSLDGGSNQTDSTFSDLEQGYYTIVVTDSVGCTNTDSINLPQYPVLTGFIVQDSIILCHGDCTAQLTMTASGGDFFPSYSFAWLPGGEVTQTISSLCAGSYSATVTDNSGCTYEDNYTVIQPDSIALTIVVDSIVNCGNDCTGQVTASTTGGSGTISYIWDPNVNNYNQATATADSLCGGIYFVVATDTNFCSVSNWIEIIDTSNLTLFVIDSTLIDCYGNCNGSYTVAASGGFPPYTYLWSNGDTDSIAENLCIDTLTVTVTDNSLCSRALVIYMVQPDSLSLIMSQTPVICNGDCNGIASVVVSGGTPGYLYAWDDPWLQGISSAAFLCAGTYTVTVIDTLGCTKTDSINIIEPDTLNASFTNITNVLCYGDTTGSATISVIGGVTPYTYIWTSGETDSTDTGLGAGWYYITTSDNNGCTRLDSIEITQPTDTLSLIFTTIESHCSLCDGSATVTPAGGTPIYTYLWDDSATQIDSTANALCAGLYNVTVTDANMCTITGLAIVQDSTSLTATVSVINHITCNGWCDGSALGTANLGNLPYTYSWNTTPIQTNDTAIGLCDTMYIFTVLDGDGCLAIDTVTITDVDALASTLNVTDIACNGGTCNGEITVIPSGGILPLDSIIWSSGPIDTNTIYDLCAGTYYVTIIDQNGCTVIDSAQIIDPPEINIAFNTDTGITCYGDCDGVITALPTGGTVVLDYTYQWDTNAGNQTTQTADSLCDGIYSITITDDNGCTATNSDTLIEPESLFITFGLYTPVNCGGDSTGEITAIGNGGPIPYFYYYAWSNGDTTALADSLWAGIYYVTVTDLNGCIDTSNFMVSDTSNIIIVVDSTNVTCFGDNDGTIDITVTGGTVLADYVYNWGTLDGSGLIVTAEDQSGLSPGTYTVTVIDDSLCTEIRSITIIEPPIMISSFIDSTNITCNGECDGSLTVTVTGGVPDYTYEWNTTPVQTDSIADTLCAGTYIVTITDSGGCADTITYNLANPLKLLIDTIYSVDALCSNNTFDGQATVSVIGGTIPYTFLWSNGDTTQTTDSLEGGSYYITATDILGCTAIDSVTIDPGIIVNSNAEADTLICSGDTVTIIGSGYQIGQIAFWATDINHTDSIIDNPLQVSPTELTTYYYFVYEDICFDVDSVVIDVYPYVGVDAGEDVEIFLDQFTQLLATGGEDTVTYQWVPETGLDNPNIANPLATPEETTVYYVYITTPAGCVEYDSVTVNVVKTLFIPSGFTPNGDGINDRWQIDNLDFFSNVLIEIYNRWGEKLFIFTGHGRDYEHVPENQWDGIWKGKPVPIGTYYFVIDFHDEYEEKPKTGPLTIMR